MTKRKIHAQREGHAESGGTAGTDNHASLAWLDEESGETLRVHVRSTDASFTDDLASIGFQRPPLGKQNDG